MNSEIQTTEYGKISASFSKSNLSKLCVEKIGVQTGPFGSQLHNEDYVFIGTPIITVEHLGENRITYQNMPRVSDKDKARLSKYCLQEGDIVFSRVGSVDRRALVRQEEDGWLFSGRCLRVRVDRTKIDPVYLSYFFGLEGFKNYIKSIAVGATMPSLNTKILSDVPIYFPELENQKKIGKILQDFDNKIALNRQINQLLESMAQAIFKSWFVDFDPVKAKIAAIEAGEDAEGVTRAAMRAISGKTDDELDQMQAGQPENYARLKTTAELFPNAMKETELGEVPGGWDVLDFDKFVSRSNEIVETQEVPEYSSTNEGLKLRSEKFNKQLSKNRSNNKLIRINDLVFGLSRQILNFGLMRDEIGAVSPVYNIFSINTKMVVSDFVEKYIRERMNFYYGMINGSSREGQSISVNQFLRMPFLIPPIKVQDELYFYLQLISKRINQTKCEINILSELRDVLLPKLMSGEISIGTNSNLNNENK